MSNNNKNSAVPANVAKNVVSLYRFDTEEDKYRALEAISIAIERLRQPSQSNALFNAIKHGDAEHQAWLKQALENYFEGLPMPPVQGGKTQHTAQSDGKTHMPNYPVGIVEPILADHQTKQSDKKKIEQLRETIVSLWHNTSNYNRPLHECLGMTFEEYAAWVNPDAKPATQRDASPCL